MSRAVNQSLTQIAAAPSTKTAAMKSSLMEGILLNPWRVLEA
jgi:hypothetical protein